MRNSHFPAWIIILFFTVTAFFVDGGSDDCPKIFWSDEFDGDSLNSDVWNVMTGDGCDYGICGWGNQELEVYSENNIIVKDGVMIIEARREDFVNSTHHHPSSNDSSNQTSSYRYTSGRINTDQHVNIDVFGRYEARIKLPKGGQGVWPAFWMLPSEWKYGGWPKSGEIDIMEQIGSEPHSIHGTIHFGTQTHKFIGRSVDIEGLFSNEYHRFAVERELNSIRWILDDVVYFSITSDDIGNDIWPFNESFYFIFNLAIGGLWPQNPNEDTEFPQRMIVDYVRVYDKPLVSLIGPREIVLDGKNDDFVEYEILNWNYTSNLTFNWSVPSDAVIVSGQGSHLIKVKFGNEGGVLGCNIVDKKCVDNNYLSMNIINKGKFRYDFSFVDVRSTSRATLVSHSGTYNVIDNTGTALMNCPSTSFCSEAVKYTRSASSKYDTIIFRIPALANAASYVELLDAFFIYIYTNEPVGTKILLQLEDSSISSPDNFPIGRHSIFIAMTEKENDWQHLRFEYAESPDVQVPQSSVDTIVLLFAPDTNTDGTYYFNNLDSFRLHTSQNKSKALEPNEQESNESPSTNPPSISSEMCPNLIAGDEFNGNQLDPYKWNYVIGDGCSQNLCGWGNGELEIYKKDNVIVNNGELRIKAIKGYDEQGNIYYTSGRINSEHKIDVVPFGRYEARMKLPFGKGLWPAFWMLPTEPLRYGTWPNSGEIDIMESMSRRESSIHVDIHYGKLYIFKFFGFFHMHHNHIGSIVDLTADESISEDFHIYAIERESDIIRWLIDDVVYRSVSSKDMGEKNWKIFNENFHFVINLAVGGRAVENPGEAVDFPQFMVVDYVRVYDRPLPSLQGPSQVSPNQKDVTYQIINRIAECTYHWTIPDGSQMTSENGKYWMKVDFGSTPGPVECYISNCICVGNQPVRIHITFLKYWQLNHKFLIKIFSAVLLALFGMFLIRRKCAKSSITKSDSSIEIVEESVSLVYGSNKN